MQLLNHACLVNNIVYNATAASKHGRHLVNKISFYLKEITITTSRTLGILENDCLGLLDQKDLPKIGVQQMQTVEWHSGWPE